VLFGREGFAVVGGDRLIYGLTDDPLLRSRNPDGSDGPTFRRDIERTPVSGGEIDSLRTESEIRRLVGRRLAAPMKGTITDPDRLLETLAEVRARGYATAYLEWEDDLATAAAPIRDESGNVLAALSVGGPASRIRRDQLQTLGELTLRHARDASAALGFTES
jgi:hypothetical protein